MNCSIKKTTAGMLLSAMVLSAPAYADDTIKFAYAGPRTGPVTQYGDMVKEGIDTAVEMINEQGGILGKKLELVVEDDACEPKQAVATANRIVSSGIKFVVGHVCSGATIAAADIYDNEGIIMVSPSATAPVLTDGKERFSIFRTTGRDDQQSPAAVDYISKKEAKKVAILHDKQSYGQGVATAVRDGLEKKGVPVVLFEGINAGESDYSAIVTKMKSEGVDFIYYGGYHPELGLIARQSRERGITAPIMSVEGAANNELLTIAGAAAEGLLMTVPKDFSKDPANEAIVKHFLDKGRDPAGAFQMSSYTSVLSIAKAIEAAGSEDVDAVVESLRKITVKSPIGDISFDKKGDLTNFSFIIVSQNKDGSRSEVTD